MMEGVTLVGGAMEKGLGRVEVGAGAEVTAWAAWAASDLAAEAVAVAEAMGLGRFWAMEVEEGLDMVVGWVKVKAAVVMVEEVKMVVEEVAGGALGKTRGPSSPPVRPLHLTSYCQG